MRDYVGVPAGGKVNFDASVSLYPACVDPSSMEGFKKVPALIVPGRPMRLLLPKCASAK